jgi:hypothetical protein
MRSTNLKEEAELRAFAIKAAAWFADDPEGATFGAVAPGEFLALRWGMGGDCVLVTRLCADFEPVNYQQAIAKAGA